MKEPEKDSRPVSLVTKRTENAQWPIDCALERIDGFDEVLVLAKKKGQESYVRFSSSLRSTFWWLGVLEAMKRNLIEESVTHSEE
jgi:hypothetical protein